MRKETILKYTENEEVKKGLEDFINYSFLENYNPEDISTTINLENEIRDILNIPNTNLKHQILFYLNEKKNSSKTRSILDEIILACRKEPEIRKELINFKANIKKEVKTEIKKEQRNKKQEKMNENYKASLTDFEIEKMFVDFDSKNYQLLGEFKEEFKLTSTKLQILEEVLREKGEKLKLAKLLYLRRISEKKQKQEYKRIHKFVYSTYDKIKNGIKQEDGTYLPYTQLDYCLGYHVDKKTFLRYMQIIGATYITEKIYNFFKPIEQIELSKEQLFSVDYTIKGHKVLESEKEKAYNLLVANEIVTNNALYKQALRKVISV